MVRRRRRSKKWISWLIILVLLVAAIIVGYQVWNNYFNDDKKTETTETDVKEEKQNETKEEPSSTQSEPEEKKETVQYEGENPNNNAGITGAITYAAVSETDLLVRVNIDQYLSSGKCEIRLLYDGDVNMYSDTANIVSSAATATCEGFNIPLSKISGGKYVIIINLTSGDKTGVINGEVDI